MVSFHRRSIKSLEGGFMPSIKATVAIAAGTFLCGALCVGVIAKNALDRLNQQNIDSRYGVLAADIRVESRSLSYLRSGDTQAAIGFLEAVLDGQTMAFSSYNDVVPSTHRDSYVYESLERVKVYRLSYPSRHEEPAQRDALNRALTLARSGAVAPPSN